MAAASVCRKAVPSETAPDALWPSGAGARLGPQFNSRLGSQLTMPGKTMSTAIST